MCHWAQPTPDHTGLSWALPMPRIRCYLQGKAFQLWMAGKAASGASLVLGGFVQTLRDAERDTPSQVF